MVMSKPSIMVGCNLLSHIPGRAYPYHMVQFYRMGKELSSKYDFKFNAPVQMSVDRMRNETAKMALQLECDYIYFYDVDVLTPSMALPQLLKANADIACGLVYIRGYPYDPMIFKYQKGSNGSGRELGAFKNFKKYIRKDGLVRVDAVGFSCALIKCDLLKKIPQPYFVTGPRNTEDIYFCVKAKDCVKDVKIVCDPKVSCGHLVDSYWVDDASVENLRSFEEQVFGAQKESSVDRGEEYLEKCKELLKEPIPENTVAPEEKHQQRNQ